MNAVVQIARLVPPEALRRLASRKPLRFDQVAASAPRQLDGDEARTEVIARWSSDLCGLLNAMTRGELAVLAHALGLAAAGRSSDLRAMIWDRGAALERGDAVASPALQPRPIVLGGHLVIQAVPRGSFPPCASWPRPIPPIAIACPPHDEPDCLDELLAAADRAVGVRLGRRGRDKGAWGNRAASLLGIREHGHMNNEPDWRGDVEIKTVPIARDPTGAWRIVEDPAIAMVGDGAVAKLQRTLWLARADVGDGDATIVSWYLLEWDAEIARLARRFLHVRPKGPAGTDAKGLYLHKRFFADAGLLATLNGSH